MIGKVKYFIVPTTANAVNRLQYGRLARYSLRNTSYCAQGLLFAASATGSAHKRPPSLNSLTGDLGMIGKVKYFIVPTTANAVPLPKFPDGRFRDER